jgi:hypothetical protein
MLFEKEFWRASTTNVVSPRPWAVATDGAPPTAGVRVTVTPSPSASWQVSDVENAGAC